MKIILTKLLLFCSLFAFSADQAKIIVVGPAKIDFGKYPANEKKEAFFILKNTGNSLLKIKKIRKTCGCSEAVVDKKELKPLETAKLKSSVLPNSISGAFSKNIYVESNDPKEHFLCLTLQGNSMPIAKIKPKDKIYAGTLKTGQKWTQDFLIEPTQKDVELIAPELLDKNFKASLVKRKDGKYDLKIEFHGDKQGAFKKKILLPVKKPLNWKPLEIIIAGNIK